MDPRLSTQRIDLVSDDTGPQLQFTITNNATGVAQNLTNCTVSLHFRAVDTTTNLFTRTAAITDAANGVATLQWQATDLANRPAGDYEGEIEVVLADSTRQTVYDTLQFRLREDFA